MPGRLSGILVVEPAVHRDERGFFLERFSRIQYAAAGIEVDFVQDNQARSRRGTIRGLHFQVPPGQPKLVSVTRGAIFDVVVDIRRSSPTFGEWESFHLDDENLRQVFVPAGFAHGYCALSEEADVVYKVGTYYDASAERGITWNDPEIGIAWPADDPIVSTRDAANPRLSEIADDL
jgi:dTDP-4-dehydrorhamnose 3,5-epimerase